MNPANDDGAAGATASAATDSLDNPVGTVQEQFALMLHERIVDIERELRELRPPTRDPRIRVLGAATHSDSGAVFVRLKCKAYLHLSAWPVALLTILGTKDPVRWDVWCCQHWGLERQCPYVVETLIERSCGGAGAGGGDTLVTTVAEAALAAAATASCVSLETCGVVSSRWFAESVRVAAAASGSATLHTWDPSTKTAVAVDITHTDETGARTPAELRTWTMLHGWLASQVEKTDVWHPRALNSQTQTIDLVSTLGILLSQHLL